MAVLQISDEKFGQAKEKALTLECLTETMTVRELIRARVYQEVQDYNQRIGRQQDKPLPKLLVTPTDAEAALNRKPSPIAPNKPSRRKPLVWEKQYDIACEAFVKNGFFVLVGDEQVEGLEESFDVAVDTEITFVKLVPLVGG